MLCVVFRFGQRRRTIPRAAWCTRKRIYQRLATMRKSALGILLLLCAAIMVIVWMYSTTVRRHEYLQWMEHRQEIFRQIGDRVRLYAERHRGELPQSMEAFVAAGLLRENELRVTDPQRGVLIVRHLRPIPAVSFPGSLVLMYETYYPPLDDGIDGQILTLDGGVVWVTNLQQVLREDAELRLSCELSIVDPERSTPIQ